MTFPTPAPCIIYCRVSDAKQVTGGDGLRSQETRCRQYAEQQGYAVLRVFHEEGLSGGLLDRRAMEELLAFLSDYQGRQAIRSRRKRGTVPPPSERVISERVVVIIEDLKRFARDVAIHFDLKLAIDARGGRLESPLFRFEDTPEGRFIETIVAAQAELERNQNRRQVLNRMRARLEQGFWTFNPVLGFRYRSDPALKKVLEPDPATAPAVAEALEGFACGRFSARVEVARFLVGAGVFGPSPRHPTRYLGHVERMLRCALYAGHLEYPPWEIGLRPAHHPALVSMATYVAIRERLRGTLPADPLRETQRAQTGKREPFALRGLVRCAACGRRLTGSVSRGRSRTYPYYHCQYRGCARYGRTVGRARLEEQFAEALRGLEASEETLAVARGILLSLEQHRARLAARTAAAAGQRLGSVEAELRGLAERLARTGSGIVAASLEERVEALTLERARLAQEAGRGVAPAGERAPTKGKPYGATSSENVRTAWERVEGLLRSPCQTWECGDLERKRQVARLVFPVPPAWDLEHGLGTADFALPYRIFQRLAGADSRLVDPSGIIPNPRNIPGEDWEGLRGTVLEWARDFGPEDVPLRSLLG